MSSLAGVVHVARVAVLATITTLDSGITGLHRLGIFLPLGGGHGGPIEFMGGYRLVALVVGVKDGLR
ncbi:MAG: hypothetical protein MPL62_04445, partial [Alphaproteobacteria bacterium]|nr:hypothetical protein [Alphaproteobacteria bacterium]